jgi:4-amino-4-deoxychorismate lyase
MTFPVWINGGERGCIDPADRGLAYGDGLFETIRIERGQAVLLDDHMDRLSAGAAVLGIAFDEMLVRKEFSRFLESCPESCVAKILLTRGCSGRGYLPDPAATPTRVFSAYPMPAHAHDLAGTGVAAGICILRLALQPRLAGIKHLNRLEQVLLRRELEELRADEALVCSFRGDVIEGVFSNVFMVRQGVLHTPVIDEAGVKGVFRTAILRHAKHQGLPVVEGRYSLDEFLAADEIFFCNSVNGVWPVRSLAGRHWAPGPVARQWQAFWLEQLRGEP